MKRLSEIIEALKSVKDVYIDYPKRYELSQEQLKKVDSEIQDIVHIIELTNFNASEGYKWAKELQRLRRIRRGLKNELETLEKIKEFLTFQRPTEKNISRVLGDLRNIENKQKIRSYRMRIREDLQNLIK